MATLGEAGSWRLIVFFGVLITLLILETLMPRRKTARDSKERLSTNALLTVFNGVVMGLAARLVVPIAAVSAAIYVGEKGWGLFNILSLDPTLEIVLSLILLDLAIYGQHVAAHYVPILWQFHKVHHSDVEFDVTTALRFHPIEIFISMLWKIVLVFILGPSAFAVILFEMILNGCAMFNHSNIKWPFWVDRFIRLFIATPDMHRIHHSIIPRELNSNYGFSISLWDRIFGTYTWQPERGHADMEIGLEKHQDIEPTKFLWSLKFPFS
ncbi:MAG: sterol desaturase family protein [Hyphomicrobiaceae bacterium]|nr:sterol desaturase family protein [Hyphomicrobiaceae bacterium]